MVSKEDELVLQLTGRLVDRVCRYIPYAGLIYDSVEKLVCDDFPAECGFMTDGAVLYVNRDITVVLDRSREDVRDQVQELSRNLAHELMHIFLRHPQNAKPNDRSHYDRESDTEVCKLSDYTRVPVRGGFMKTSHDLWYANALSKAMEEFLKNHRKELQNLLVKLMEKEKKEDAEENGSGGLESMSPQEIMLKLRENAEDRLETLIGQIQSMMKTETENYGSESGTGEGRINNMVSQHISFEDILRQYMTVRAQACNNDDELDHIMYTYGLSLYDNIAIVESLEEAELPEVQFYLAIDSSGSIDLELAEIFLAQARDAVLRASGQGKKEVDVDLFVCDTEITQSFHIENADDFPMAGDVTLTGGGTAFEPVMNRVAELIEQKGQENNTALFYFSDGCGSFPDAKPDYDVFFVMENDNANRYMPDWVTVVTL